MLHYWQLLYRTVPNYGAGTVGADIARGNPKRLNGRIELQGLPHLDILEYTFLYCPGLVGEKVRSVGGRPHVQAGFLFFLRHPAHDLMLPVNIID